MKRLATAAIGKHPLRRLLLCGSAAVLALAAAPVWSGGQTPTQKTEQPADKVKQQADLEEITEEEVSDITVMEPHPG
jgi:hypothetical protein